MDMPLKFATCFALIVIAVAVIIYFVALYWPDPEPVVIPASRSNRHVRPKQCSVRARRDTCNSVSRVHAFGYVSFNQGRDQSPHQSNNSAA